MPKKYAWPCSQVDRDLMHELHLESKAAGVPITTIIAAAVGKYLNAKLEVRLASPVTEQHAA